jgi:hypothetical protein
MLRADWAISTFNGSDGAARMSPAASTCSCLRGILGDGEGEGRRRREKEKGEGEGRRRREKEKGEGEGRREITRHGVLNDLEWQFE